MSIKQQLDLELNRLVVLGSTDQIETILLRDDNCQIECTVMGVDGIGCRLQRISLSTDVLRDASIEKLKEVANELTRRLVYLLESIAPIEVDNEEVSVQLRSNPPHKTDNGTHYYELVVNRRGLSLCRYEKTRGEVRQVTATAITREILVRLIDDFCTVAV